MLYIKSLSKCVILKKTKSEFIPKSEFLSVEVPYNIMWYCNTLIPTYNTSYFVGKVVRCSASKSKYL